MNSQERPRRGNGRVVCRDIVSTLRPVGAIGLLVAGAAVATAESVDLFDLEPEALTEVVFAASNRAQAATETATHVYVITAAEIAASGATSLDQVLRRVPGFQVRTWLWGFTNTSLHGLLGGSPINERLLWLVDGIPFNDVRDGGIWTDPTIFPLENIARIEVVPGPHSSVWGSSAFQGVVNIITKSTAELSRRGDYSVSYGAFHTQTAAVALPLAADGVESTLFANLYATDEHRLVSDHSGKQAAWIYGKSRVGGFSCAYGARLADLKYPSVFASPYEHYSEGRSEYFGHARHVSEFGGAGSLHLLTAFHAWNDRFYDFGDVPGLQYEQTSYRWHNSLQWILPLRSADKLVVGLGTRSDFYDGDDFRPGHRTIRETQVNGYLEYEARLGERLLLFGGGRIDTPRGEDLSLHPRAALRFQLHPRWALRALYSSAYREPSYWHRYIDTVDASGNPDLRSEELRGLELALEFESSALSASAIGFHQTVEDGILEIYDPTLAEPEYLQYGIFGKFTPVQADGNYDIDGLDLVGSLHLADSGLRLDGWYSYLDSRLPDGRDTPYDAKHKAYLGCRWKVRDGLELATGGHWVSRTRDAELEHAPVDPENPAAGTIGRRPVPAYWIGEAGVRCRLPAGFGLAASIWDWGNDTYEQYLGSSQKGRLWRLRLEYPYR